MFSISFGVKIEKLNRWLRIGHGEYGPCWGWVSVAALACFREACPEMGESYGHSKRAPQTWCCWDLNHICHFLLRKTCSPALFSPLFPHPPESNMWSYSNAPAPMSVQERFAVVSSFDLAELFCSIRRHPFVPNLGIVIGLRAAHPAGAMDLSLCKATGRSMRPCSDIRFSANAAEDTLLTVNGTFALIAIVTAISVQL